MQQPIEQERQLQLEQARSVLNSLTLPDIFGRKRDQTKKVPITLDQYRRWSDGQNEAELDAFALSHGIEEIGVLMHGQNGNHFIIESSSTKKLAWWVPHIQERQVILQLAESIKGSDRPKILEVGHGSGLVANLLAFDGKADVMGIDNNAEKLANRNMPNAPGVSFYTADIWDSIEKLGPSYSDEIAERRKKLFEAIREGGASLTGTEHFPGLLFGKPRRFNAEIDELQALSTQFTEQGAASIVLCSFMALGAELTVPIRDGIFPKIIIYVRPDNGKSGAGDYYSSNYDVFDEDEDADEEGPVKIGENTHVSFNPGVNYRTVLRWNTPWPTDYPSYGYDWEEKEVKDCTAEVIVQIRRDVNPEFIKSISPERFNFDDEMDRLLTKQPDGFPQNIYASRVG